MLLFRTERWKTERRHDGTAEWTSDEKSISHTRKWKVVRFSAAPLRNSRLLPLQRAEGWYWCNPRLPWSPIRQSRDEQQQQQQDAANKQTDKPTNRERLSLATQKARPRISFHRRRQEQLSSQERLTPADVRGRLTVCEIHFPGNVYREFQ